MNRVIAALIGVLCWVASAAAQLVGDSVMKSVVATTPYTGSGDIGGASGFWYGVRAFSSASRGSRALNVCNSTGGVDVGCADMLTSPATGDLVAAVIAGITCPGPNCTIAMAYDQTGNGWHLPQATVASRPTLPANCIGSRPCMACNGSQSLVSASGPTIFQPYTISSAAIRTGNTFTGGDMWISLANSAQLFFRNFPGFVSMYAFNEADVVAPDGSYYAVQGLFNGASSSMYLNGTLNSPLDAGTVFMSGGIGMCNGLLGNILEMGEFGNISPATQSALDANQRAYWGF